MQVVALISGGKDSTFNAMHCIANGHQLVALANLQPPPGIDELDSYMYQTVGHDLLSAYAECYGLPLYRRVIKGTARNTSNEYKMQEDGDEVEDLLELLQEVKRYHPNVQGVSSGAIFSNYQRVRVENVCSRLGLVSLAFLWQQDQVRLLRAMVDNEIDAVLVKVAAMGLKKCDLGLSIKELATRIDSLHAKYQLNPCGEGGEYETVTLDCPIFKRKIVIDECQQVILRDCDFAPVCYLKIIRFHTEDKPLLKKWDLRCN